MKHLPATALCLLLLTSCSSNYHYQSEQQPQQWQGQNISAVQQRWGTADQTFHTRSGVSYYVYLTTSGRNFYNATSTNFALAETSADFPLRGQGGLKCSAIFKTNAKDVIISTSHSGYNCGGEWAPHR